MKSVSRVSVFALLVLFAVLLVSCGGNDDTGTKPTPNEPPSLESPPLTQQIDFHSTNPMAQNAQRLVQSQLATATAMSSLSRSIVAPTKSAHWNRSGDCWSWVYTANQCQSTYEACEVADGYTWSVTFDGTCGENVFHDWLAMNGESNDDGTSGTLHFYESNSTAIVLSVTWTLEEDRHSGTWNFYEGDVDPENLVGTMDWSQTTDSSGQMTWVSPEQAKWELTYADNGGSGTMRLYDWSDSAWVITMEIVWNTDGTGSWTTYDETGGSETRTW